MHKTVEEVVEEVVDGHLAVQLIRGGWPTGWVDDDRQEVVEEETPAAKLTDEQIYYGLKLPSPVTETFSEMFVSKFDSRVVWLVTYIMKVSKPLSEKRLKKLKFASPGGRDAEHRDDGQHRGRHRGRPHPPLEEAGGGVQEPRPPLRHLTLPFFYIQEDFLCFCRILPQSDSPAFCQSSS